MCCVGVDGDGSVSGAAEAIGGPLNWGWGAVEDVTAGATAGTCRTWFFLDLDSEGIVKGVGVGSLRAPWTKKVPATA